MSYNAWSLIVMHSLDESGLLMATSRSPPPDMPPTPPVGVRSGDLAPTLL
jgi:hypothetical protein